MKTTVIGFTVALFNAALVAGCGYLVLWRGHSALWFLLVLMLISKRVSPCCAEARRQSD